MTKYERVTDCSCEPDSFPFQCPRHLMLKDEVFFKHCCTSYDYCQAWDIFAQKKEKRQPAPRVKWHEKTKTCAFNVRRKGSIPCTTCRGGKKRANIYECKLHGLCTERAISTRLPNGKRPKACSTCEEYQHKDDIAEQDRKPKEQTYALTIGIPTYDDFDGLYMTIKAIHLYHSEILDDTELVVVDNNPGGHHAKHNRQITDKSATYFKAAVYVPFTDATGTAQPRNKVFDVARGNAVLCLDSHVFMHEGSLNKLMDYYDAHRNTKDLLVGPLVLDNGVQSYTHQDQVWRAMAYGIWATDHEKLKANKPFEVPQHGLGMFSCLRRHWVKYHKRMRGFGGSETYLCEKVRRKGGRVMHLPFLKWSHRFQRPEGHVYPLSEFDKARNYIIGFHELGLDLQQVFDHFAGALTREEWDAIIKETGIPAIEKDVMHV